MMINAWNITQILPVGKSSNSFGLPTNCYYCTASALQNTNCNDLVVKTEVMQYDGGNIENFKELFSVAITHQDFSDIQEAINFLLIQLPVHQAVAFAYNRTNGTGHMIVVFKAQLQIDSQGNVGVSQWGNLRHLDYQSPNPQPVDGILPHSEDLSKITKFHVFHL